MDESLTVLVADDDEELRDLYGHWVGDHELRLAADGDEALALFDDGVDVDLLDRKMPGPSGVDLAARLDAGPDCYVALVSSMQLDLDLATTPVDRYVCKPVRETTVERVFEAYRNKQRCRELLDEIVELTEQLGAADGASEVDRAALRERVERRRAELDDLLGEEAAQGAWTTAFCSLEGEAGPGPDLGPVAGPGT